LRGEIFVKEIIKFVLFIFIFFISNIEIFAEPVVVSGIQYITTNEILKIFQKQLPADNRTIIYSKVPRGLVLSIDKSIFFEQDSVVLKDESNVILDKIGKILK
jgi:CRISPR/Cas system CMR subunit Cmr4 (Cas7 group RAMP superfamily)